MLNNNNQFQFKIDGPTLIRILSRSDENEKNLYYNFQLMENGIKMSDHTYKTISSKQNAKIASLNKSLTKYDSFYFNTSLGLNYYTLKVEDDLDSNIYIKIESYLNENNDEIPGIKWLIRSILYSFH